ncbi:MAG: hypothetical protein M1828_001613 [Chrysothrix sp. TS-e1954]|nr:MAG: hypothetical protein M1828_001613 [Chrysothrix sp. TS-e1954]
MATTTISPSTPTRILRTGNVGSNRNQTSRSTSRVTSGVIDIYDDERKREVFQPHSTRSSDEAANGSQDRLDQHLFFGSDTDRVRSGFAGDRQIAAAGGGDGDELAEVGANGGEVGEAGGDVHESGDPIGTALIPEEKWETLTPGYFARRVTERLGDYDEADGMEDDVEDDDEEDGDQEGEEEQDGYETGEQDDPFDETDPFEDDASTSPDPLHDAKQAAQSTNGIFHAFQPPGISRDVSRSTAIHLAESYPIPAQDRDRQPRVSYGSDTLGAASHHADSRKVSSGTALSSMPDELSYYQSSIPHRHMRSPLAESPGTGNAGRDSTPSGAFTPLTPLTKKRAMHSRAQSAFEGKENVGRPVFRNPSSVRAMQMSSPSPPPMSSVSRRRRMLSELGEGRQGTPSKHPDPRKEYPLVLLHCTVHTLLSYDSGIVEDVCCTENGEDGNENVRGIVRDAKLLEEKLSEKVLERGVLISHPGEDYEVLEERVLESLELRRPRVGGCGHFHEGAAVDDIDGAHLDSVDSCACTKAQLDEDLGRKNCADCGKHISHTLLQGHGNEGSQERTRRWDIRVYASNGLMRAGAWSAAWREMEKVDVEIGVWMPDSVKRKLDDRMRQLRQEQRQHQQRTPERANIRRPMHARTMTATTAEPLASMPTAAAAPGTPASKAACSRAPSMEIARSLLRHRDDSPLRGRGHSSPEHSPRHDPAETQTLPLSTLMQEYLARQLRSKRDFILPVLILLLGLVLAGRNLLSNAATAGEAAVRSAAVVGPSERGLFVDAETAAMSLGGLQEGGKGERELGVFASLPVCAFQMQEAEWRRMVALEWTQAQRCLSREVEDGEDGKGERGERPESVQQEESTKRDDPAGEEVEPDSSKQSDCDNVNGDVEESVRDAEILKGDETTVRPIDVLV